MQNFFSRLGLALAVMLLTAALPYASSVQAADNALESIKKAGVLAVAVPQDFPPFGSVGSDMQPVGYDIDTARLIAKSLGVKVKLVPVTSTNRIPYLTSPRARLIWSSHRWAKIPSAKKLLIFLMLTRLSSTASLALPTLR